MAWRSWIDIIRLDIQIANSQPTGFKKPLPKLITMSLMFMQIRDNVLDVNPPGGARSLTLNGSHWLWAVTTVFALSFVRYFLDLDTLNDPQEHLLSPI